MPFAASQIDEANLNYHYTKESYPNGVYYRLKSGDARFPGGFWDSERQVAQQQQATPAYTSQIQAPTSYSYQQVGSSSALEDRVVTIRVVAHTLGPVAPGAVLSQNHWSMYLLLSDAGSVQINMQTDTRPGVLQGIYSVNRRAYTESRTAVQWWDTSTVHGLTVAQIEHEITERGWHRYNMTDTGVGCRHWILTLLRGFATKGWINAGDVEKRLQGALQFNYSKDLAPVSLPMREGSFY